MRYIFFTFSSKKSFYYKAFFFPYENILSANNVYFAKFFFFQLSFATNEQQYPDDYFRLITIYFIKIHSLIKIFLEIQRLRSSPSKAKVFLGKGVLKIHGKLT